MTNRSIRHQPRRGGAGGGGDTHQSFIRGSFAPKSKPLPFYIPFLIEKVPLSYTFHRKLYPFHIPTERPLLNFEKPLETLGWISCYLRLFEIFLKSLLIPNWQFSQPFSTPQLVKSISLYIAPAWKGYPFPAEPHRPRIVHYRELPPPPAGTSGINSWSVSGSWYMCSSRLNSRINEKMLNDY